MAEGNRKERVPVPRFGSRADWPRYALGMLSETAFVLVLSVFALLLALLAKAVVG